MEVDIPNPNPALGQWMASADCGNIVGEIGEKALALWQGQVAKESGALSATGRVEVGVGGAKNDRMIAEVIIGEGVVYGAAHEFGYTPAKRIITKSRTHRIRVRHSRVPGHHELNAVLEELGSI